MFGRSRTRRPGDRADYAAGLVLLLVATAGSAFAQSMSESLRETDGILLVARSDADGVTVDWRFLHPPPAPVRRIEVDMNGQPLGRPAMPIAAFPARGQTAVVDVVVGGGDASSAAARSSLAALSSELPAGVEVRIRGGDIAPPQDGGAAVDDRSALDLATALERAIDDIGARPADRRAIVVFPATMASVPFSIETLSARARANSIAVFVVADRTKPYPEAAALDALSRATSGRSIAADGDLGDTLLHTFLSGARLRFPYGAAARYLWQSTASVTASLFYGDHKLVVAVESDPPAAGWRRSIEAFWERAASRLSAFLAGALLMLILVAVFRFRRGPRIF